MAGPAVTTLELKLPSSLHTMNCHNDLSLIYTSLRGDYRSPSTNQQQIRLSCGCEAPTQTQKSHHQTHEAPASLQRWFSPNEGSIVVPTMIPTCLTLRPREITCPKLQNSTNLIWAIYHHKEGGSQCLQIASSTSTSIHDVMNINKLKLY